MATSGDLESLRISKSLLDITPASITTPVLVDKASTKRTHGIFVDRAADKIAHKKKKLTGRPKNAWTPSRSRKLVRLYLMTSLAVDDFVKVLRTNHFAPCKRDIQKQLQTLLQSRPSKLRSRGIMTKVRLHHLRECRAIEITTASQIEPKNHHFDLLECTHSTAGSMWPKSMTETNISNYFGGSVSQNQWNEEPTEPDNEISGAGSIVSKLKTPAGDGPPRTTSSTRPISHAGSPLSKQIPLLSSKFKSKSRNALSLSSKLCQPALITTHVTVEASPESLGGETLDSEASIQGQRIITFETESCRASVVSVNSLRRRLATETESCLEDIISVLQNLTISGSTKSRTMPDRSKSCKAPSYISSNLEEDEYAPLGAMKQQSLGFISQEKVLLNHTVILPGSFTSYIPATNNSSIWGFTNQRCFLCETGFSNPTDSLHICGNIQGRELQQVDVFGNTVLHISAASGQNLQRLINLVNLGADIHAMNSAGQTFLHLTSIIQEEDCIHLSHLLRLLQRKSFNFSLRDDHGQTVLHHVTRQWMDKAALGKIAKVLISSGIILPSSRDNLGRTILGQMTDIGLDIPQIDYLRIKTAINVMAHERKGQSRSNELSIAKSQSSGVGHYQLSNYGPCTGIETMADLHHYAIHADLLRTIVRASTFSNHEDTEGRNGLHCLAEVSLKLPVPHQSPSNIIADDADNAITRREAYLYDILASGVDPDNCDKRGVTPLMAFIIHNRDDDDDNTTIRILTRLRDVGVNINRRDGQGQTALHISVKLGKVAVTKFLLNNGANIHARDSGGNGIIAVGQLYSKRVGTDAKLYASIMLCISYVVDAGAVSVPSQIQEWGLRS